MNQKKILIGILVVLVIGIVSYAGFFTNMTGKPTQVATCSDTDGDYNIYSRGVVSGVDGNGLKYDDKIDVCFTKDGKDWIKEYYCDWDGGPGSRVIWAYKMEPCDNSCSNGACL